MTLEFLVTSLVVVLVPGTGVIYTISSGLSGGIRKSLWAALGCTFGILPHIAASLLGLSALLNASAAAFSVLKYAGTAYLLYLAWQMWNDKSDYSSMATGENRGGFSTMGKAILMNILNPKLTIFFLAFLPQFVTDTGAGAMPEMIALSLVFMLLTLAVFVVYGLLAHTFRELVLKNPGFLKIMNRSFAGILAFFGVQLALSER